MKRKRKPRVYFQLTSRSTIKDRDIRDVRHSYHVAFYHQPLFKRLKGRLYHKVWERLTWKLYRRIEKSKFYKRRVDRDWDKQDAPFFIPLTNRQDIRCHYLTHDTREFIGMVEIPEELFNALKGSQGDY